MKQEVVYVKLPQSVQVVNRKIFLQDVAELLATDADIQKKVGNIILYTVAGDKNQKMVFSAMKIIQMIQKEYPFVAVENIGEPDFVLEYKMPLTPKKGMEYVKLIILSLIVFIGAAFTIMTFNTDVSVGDVFSLFYKLVMGTEQTKGSIMEITYCIGIAIGILGFYNHFSARNERDDPTPLHLEMRNYEQEMNNAMIKNASREGKEIS